ncbi:hypothetical protein [Candidatus Nanohalobium constans]|uniref:Uncharacterized protein n=1 Tax=Candidatus Nanohalobium constans TaxID=2565781 RepID=A0A5Q0UHX0_9ARCH|nr:hypothetical protein [Candidatus Nanohalobium constans]QGA80941.1 hypothetical protein LC1Nh_1070 [Candidatus Nanohalobium constans]
MSGQGDPVQHARRLYNEVLEPARKAVAAADHHPEVPLEQDSVPKIGAVQKTYEDGDEDEAMQDLRDAAYSLSNVWDEARQYISGPFPVNSMRCTAVKASVEKIKKDTKK